MTQLLAIGYWLDFETSQTFTLSRPVDVSMSKEDIVDLLCNEESEIENLDTVLVLENGENVWDPPKVVHHWTAGNGDLDMEEVEYTTTVEFDSGVDLSSVDLDEEER